MWFDKQIHNISKAEQSLPYVKMRPVSQLKDNQSNISSKVSLTEQSFKLKCDR